MSEEQKIQNKQNELILIFGDSLSAEYGLERGTGWVALLEEKLLKNKKFKDFKIVNFSISGETTAGGRTRFPEILKKHQPSVVILELGANDGLQGLSLKNMEENLEFLILESQKIRAEVLLIGMQIPPNYGKKYTNEFTEIFFNLSRENKLALVPFFLKNIADVKNPIRFFQLDRIHPNEKAQKIMLKNVWLELEKILNKK